MRRGSFKGKHKESMTGRKFIIVVVVLTSAMTFTLGYFVGKAEFKGKQPQPSEIESQSQAIAIHPQQEIGSALQEQPTQNAEQPVQNKEDAVQLTAGQNSLKDTSIKTIAVQKENSPPSSSQTPLSKGGKGETVGLSAIKDDGPVQNATVYTVQAGAFKNSKDAAVLKHKLENKGYKTYIKKFMEGKNTKIFKVRIGEFADREKADTLALKLKNTEGLNAFVTLKNEKQEVRNGK